LFTVARRRVVDHHRRNGRQQTSLPLDRVADSAGVVDVAAEATSRVSAAQAIELLTRNPTNDQAEVIRLRVVGDLSMEQTALVMGRSAGSVRVLQHRAVQRLAKISQEVVTK
jgi:RNA polymerase sigma-70 factor (ECF subfamily)